MKESDFQKSVDSPKSHAPKSPRASDIRKKFQSQSIDDISKQHRRSLHESMLGAEIIGKNFDDVLDVPDHLELHESQKVVRPKMKEKTRNKVSWSLLL